MKRVIICCILCSMSLIAALTNSCVEVQVGEFEVYKSWDLYQVDLLKEHRLISADRGFNWVYVLQKNPLYPPESSLHNNSQITSNHRFKVAVTKPFIFIKCDEYDYQGDYLKLWFVVNTSNNAHRVYGDSTEFNAFLDSSEVANIAWSREMKELNHGDKIFE